MPNGYTAGVIDGEYSAKDYLEACARSRGFAIMQRDEPASEKVRYRERSDYYDKALVEAQAEYDAWLMMTTDEIKALYAEYVEKQKESNQRSIAKASEASARIQAVRDEIIPLDWPTELHSMRDDALKWLDETEEWDGKAYISSIEPYDEWVINHDAYLRRAVKYAREGVEREDKNVAETNRYIDLYHGVIDQLGEK
jgi:hypothetical protein